MVSIDIITKMKIGWSHDNLKNEDAKRSCKSLLFTFKPFTNLND